MPSVALTPSRNFSLRSLSAVSFDLQKGKVEPMSDTDRERFLSYHGVLH